MFSTIRNIWKKAPRATNAVDPEAKPVGELDAGNPHGRVATNAVDPEARPVGEPDAENPHGRADVIAKEIVDITDHYSRVHGYERYELVSAFDYTKSDLEFEHGEFTRWTVEDKIAVGKQLVDTARKQSRETPSGANGLALLGLYLELQSLPGSKAASLAKEIEDWHRRAVAADKRQTS